MARTASDRDARRRRPSLSAAAAEPYLPKAGTLPIRGAVRS